jgi:Spy/CpxP family protein refolding chaperone
LKRFRSSLSSVVLAILVSVAVTHGVLAYRSPIRAGVAASSDPLDVLNLSAEQKQKIQAVAMAHHAPLVSLQSAVDAKRLELAALLSVKGALDAAAVAEALQQVSRLESELDQEVVKNLVELRPLLTEEQQRDFFTQIELRHPRDARQSGGRP